MKLSCEEIFTRVFPALRGMVAKELIENYGMKQKEVAKLLGITQPAISQYINKIRGNKLKFFCISLKLKELSKEIAKKLVINKQNAHLKVCDICERLGVKK